MQKIAFGVRLPIGGSIPSVEGVRKVALESERLGYASVYARDNLTWTTEQQLMHVSEGARDSMKDDYTPVHYEPVVVFAYLASITQKIRLVFSVACLDFRPAIVWAKQVATLDAMSNGRVDFGISPGGWKNVAYTSFGVPWEERGAICDETIYAIKELWTKTPASFNGKYVRFKDVVQYPKPVQKPCPPILFGAPANPGIIRRVAEYCDGWFPDSSYVNPQKIAEGVEKIKERAEKIGRTNKQFSVHLQVATCVAKTDEEAWKKSKRTMVVDERNAVKDDAALLDNKLIGSPATIVKQVERYSEAGVTDFELLFVYLTLDDLLEQMNILTREVFPSFSMRTSG